MPQDADGIVFRNNFSSSHHASAQEEQELEGAVEDAAFIHQHHGHGLRVVQDTSPAATSMMVRRQSSSGSQRTLPRPLHGGPSYKQQVRDSDSRDFVISASSTESEYGRSQQQSLQDSSPSDTQNIVIAHAKLLPDVQLDSTNTVLSEIQMGGAESTRSAAGTAATKQGSTHKSPSTLRSDDSTRLAQSKKKWMLALGGLLLVIIAIVVGVVVALNEGDEDSPPGEPEILQVGSSLHGSEANAFFGTALALSESGHRMAVASPSVIRVFEFMDDEWQQLGLELDIASSPSPTENAERLNQQGHELISVAMDAVGEYVVAGFGLGSFENGTVLVYRFVDGAWDSVGQPLIGTESGGRFGASVAMNAAGNVIAVGAPGQEGTPGSVSIYQFDSTGEWGLRGDPILGDAASTTVSELGRSVSLSAEGHRVAAGARSSESTNMDVSTPSNVVSVYEYDRFNNQEWTQLGEGIGGVLSTKSTGWFVELDAEGKRMAVSNTYTQESDFENTDPNELVVQAYEFENESWIDFGERLHGNITGSKSGYLISYSDDGLTMAMGDRGTSEGGRSRGHAHIYKYIENEWVQVGENIEGVADGDNFGFSVSLSGDGTRFAAGAPYSRAFQNNAGQVMAFDLIDV